VDRDSTIQLLSDLVSIDSVNPSPSPDHAGEGELGGYLLDWFRSREIDVREQRVIDDRSNLIARVGGGGRRLLIVSHMDTVGVNGMTIPPFQPVVEDDYLYGRGSADTKGGMTASLLALEGLHETAELLNGEVIFAATVDEEFEARGTERLVEEPRRNGRLARSGGPEPFGDSVGDVRSQRMQGSRADGIREHR